MGDKQTLLKIKIMSKITLTIETKEVAFNEMESTILIGLYLNCMLHTSGEFGYALDVRKQTGLNVNQYAGYLSSLSKKGVFEYLDNDYSTTYGGQFTFAEGVYSQLAKITGC